MKRLFIFSWLLAFLGGNAVRSEEAAGPSADANLQEEKARAEAEKARAEAEKAKAEAARAKAEEELWRLELQKARGKKSRRREVYQPPSRRLRPAGPPPGFHTHDGFFLRFALGPGFGWYNSTGHVRLLGTSLVLTNPQDSQLAFGGSLSLGGSISENFVLHFTAWGSGLNSVSGSPEIDELNQALFGGGLTYYWLPENFFITGVVGFASGEIWVEKRDYWDRRDPDETTRGLGLMLMGGKEWWVSANWGLGLALGLEYIYSEGRDISIRQLGLRLLFTATYN